MNEKTAQFAGGRRAGAGDGAQRERRSPFLIVADHAGNLIPRALGRLGVSEAECERHIALGHRHRAGVPRCCRTRSTPPLVQQNYSRLVIDCNRTPGTETSMPEISELTPVPGNIGLERQAKRPRACARFSGHTTIASKASSTGGGKPAGPRR